MDAAHKQAILDFVSNGGGFVGIHSATDTFYAWPEYGQLVGARFNGHPWHEDVGLKVVGPAHPATAHLPATFRITDEIYQFEEFAASEATVLVELDTAATDMNKAGIEQQPFGFPLTWIRSYGSGRVFYTALGHGAVWDDQRFRTHVRNGILWAAGMDAP